MDGCFVLEKIKRGNKKKEKLGRGRRPGGIWRKPK
jgi:hypothetical protein